MTFTKKKKLVVYKSDKSKHSCQKGTCSLAIKLHMYAMGQRKSRHLDIREWKGTFFIGSKSCPFFRIRYRFFYSPFDLCCFVFFSASFSDVLFFLQLDLITVLNRYGSFLDYFRRKVVFNSFSNTFKERILFSQNIFTSEEEGIR